MPWRVRDQPDVAWIGSPEKREGLVSLGWHVIGVHINMHEIEIGKTVPMGDKVY